MLQLNAEEQALCDAAIKRMAEAGVVARDVSAATLHRWMTNLRMGRGAVYDERPGGERAQRNAELPRGTRGRFVKRRSQWSA